MHWSENELLADFGGLVSDLGITAFEKIYTKGIHLFKYGVLIVFMMTSLEIKHLHYLLLSIAYC